LHQSLYDHATSILERASKKRQKMAIASSRWTRLEQGLEEETNWLRTLGKKVPSLESIASGDCEKYCTMHQVSMKNFLLLSGVELLGRT